ncbi:hypothetical protein E1B28_000397 [Marasmius oreades]|uniref:MYND-type domain-containing protein n=1 Tax=Marasmius oreades TaxID=181124 RepID=A0A9P7V1C9_9AGAR|nr:uncharacterized protein E1B28_000397 [Marasmius oreades]KAG7098447.1 hypothetical protein E1B28_000397 [Marasmius oreades]
MSKLTFMGKEYEVQELNSELVGLAAELAKNAKIQDPPPANEDLTPEDDKKVQEQINAITKIGFPRVMTNAWWNAFIAQHLPALVSALKNASRETQKLYVSMLIEILSLFPDPKESSYFRRFLTNSELCIGLPTLIARHFVEGIEWKRPSGPGHICTLIIHTVHWCDPSLGDDGKCSIDADIRARLCDKTKTLIDQLKGRLEQMQLIEIERLNGLLGFLDSLPGGQYVRSTRDYLEGQVDMCERWECGEDEAPLRCSKCRSARYCGKKCQNWHWKNGHKLNCFESTF